MTYFLPQTFDECVSQSRHECSLNRMWLQVPFLCGQAAACWQPGNTWALAKAKVKSTAALYFIPGSGQVCIS